MRDIYCLNSGRTQKMSGGHLIKKNLRNSIFNASNLTYFLLRVRPMLSEVTFMSVELEGTSGSPEPR